MKDEELTNDEVFNSFSESYLKSNGNSAQQQNTKPATVSPPISGKSENLTRRFGALSSPGASEPASKIPNNGTVKGSLTAAPTPTQNQNTATPNQVTGLVNNGSGGGASNNPTPGQDPGSLPQQQIGFPMSGGLPMNFMQNGDPSSLAGLHSSPAGIRGQTNPQALLAQQQFLAQNQHQRQLMFQQNQRYLLQQQMMANGVMAPNMPYLNNSNMLNNNPNARLNPLYQQREVYAQHHKQVQMLKLQQNNARQQLMISRQNAAGIPGGGIRGSVEPQSGAPPYNHVNFPGNPAGMQNPLLMQQMMSMNAMANMSNSNGMQPGHMNMGNQQLMNNQSSQTPGQSLHAQMQAQGQPQQQAHQSQSNGPTPGATGSNPTSASNQQELNFEAIFGQMQGQMQTLSQQGLNNGFSGANSFNGVAQLTNQQQQAGGSKPNSQAPIEEDTNDMFNRFMDGNMFLGNDNTNQGNNTTTGGNNQTEQSNTNNNNDQSNNNDDANFSLMGGLDPFAQNEYY